MKCFASLRQLAQDSNFILCFTFLFIFHCNECCAKCLKNSDNFDNRCTKIMFSLFAPSSFALSSCLIILQQNAMLNLPFIKEVLVVKNRHQQKKLRHQKSKTHHKINKKKTLVKPNFNVRFVGRSEFKHWDSFGALENEKKIEFKMKMTSKMSEIEFLLIWNLRRFRLFDYSIPILINQMKCSGIMVMSELIC